MLKSEKIRDKSVFTTGEVAKICNISQQTVIRCFDSGRLRGFRVPGSRFRRVPRDQLITFMQENDIPLDMLEGATRRILIVDDEPAIVQLLTDVMERDGRFVIKSSATGFEAGMMTQEFMPDVILLDFKLPDINGTEVCRMVRSRSEMNNTRIIIISGVADPTEIDELYLAGADAFIKKPFRVDEVIARIDTMLKY